MSSGWGRRSNAAAAEDGRNPLSRQAYRKPKNETLKGIGLLAAWRENMAYSPSRGTQLFLSMKQLKITRSDGRCFKSTINHRSHYNLVYLSPVKPQFWNPRPISSAIKLELLLSSFRTITRRLLFEHYHQQQKCSYLPRGEGSTACDQDSH